MSFVERVNQGESLASWLNWLTEPPAVSWSVIMGDLSAIWKGEILTHLNAFRTGPGSCAVHSIQFEFTDGFELMHKAWCSIEEVPYYFSGYPLNFKVTRAEKSMIQIQFE